MQKVNGFLSQTLEWLAAAYEQRKGVLLVVTMAAFTLTGIALFLWGTARYGIGIRTDSVDYLWSAKDLAHGIGLGTLDAFGKLKAMNHYPPLYPILSHHLKRWESRAWSVPGGSVQSCSAC